MSRSNVVAVAGATSYLARFLLPALVRSGWSVVPILRSSNDVSRLPRTASGYPSILASEGFANIAEDLARLDVAAVINCITCYGRRGEPAAEMVTANVTVPLQLQAAAERAGLRLLLSLGSALLPETSIYALTKAMFESLADRTMQGRTRICVVRPEMFFGPGDPDRTKFTNALFDKLRSSASHIDMTSGEQIREFLFVTDVADGILRFLEAEVDLGPGFVSFGAGPGHAISIKDFALRAKRLSGSTTELRFGAVPDRHGPEGDPAIEKSRLVSLGWSPKVEMDEGIRHCLDGTMPAGWAL